MNNYTKREIFATDAATSSSSSLRETRVLYARVFVSVIYQEKTNQ